MWKESVAINRISLFGVPWLMVVLVCMMRWIYAPHQRRYFILRVFFFRDLLDHSPDLDDGGDGDRNWHCLHQTQTGAGFVSGQHPGLAGRAGAVRLRQSGGGGDFQRHRHRLVDRVRLDDDFHHGLFDGMEGVFVHHFADDCRGVVLFLRGHRGDDQSADGMGLSAHGGGLLPRLAARAV